MKIHLSLILFFFSITACGSATNYNNTSDQLNDVKSSSLCTDLLGEYKISTNSENDYFAYFIIKPSGQLDFEVGVLDNYQPLIGQSVLYTCKNNSTLVFKFIDDYGNNAIGVLKKNNTIYNVDFNVIGKFREDMGTTNIERNYDRYTLKKISNVNQKGSNKDL